MSNRLIVFGVTMAAGGIENLMHYFLMDCVKKNIFKNITIVSSYPMIAFEKDYIDQGIDVVHISSWRKNRIYTKEINSVLSDLDCDDIVYVNLSTYCNWPLLSCLSKIESKVIIHGHNAHVGNPIKKIIHKIGRCKFKKIGYKIAVSEECSRFMFKGKHSAIISNGIYSDNYLFDFRKREIIRDKLSIDNKKIVVGCVGRISREKNQLYLAKISRKYKEIVFLFVGDFMDKGYKKSVLAHSLSNCRFVGNQSNVGDYLSAMDALVIPSKREAFPLAAIEALTNGLPIFFCKKLLGKIPLSISTNKNCYFIEKHELNLEIIRTAHLNRNNNDVLRKTVYDVNAFLDSIYKFLYSEVFCEY